MKLQSGFAALAKLQQYQCDGPGFLVADQHQLLGFQTAKSAAGDKLRQFFRFVYQIKITAVLSL